MLANSPRLAVIDGGKDDLMFRLALPAIAGSSGADIDALNALLSACGSDPMGCASAASDLPTMSLPASLLPDGIRMTHIRGYHGILKGALSTMDVVVVSSASSAGAAATSPDRDTVLRACAIARQFRRDDILCVHAGPDAEAAPLSVTSQAIRHITFATLVDHIAGTPAAGQVLVVAPCLYRPLCDLLGSLSGASALSVTASNEGAVRLSPVMGWTAGSLLPALAVALFISGETAAAGRLENAWLRTLEDGFVTDGIAAIKPYARQLHFTEFCGAVRINVGAAPKSIARSFSAGEEPAARLTLVR